MLTKKEAVVKASIDKIEMTDECLSSRAGMAVVSRYLRNIGILNILAKQFWFLKKNKKAPLRSMFHQLLGFFFDGTSFHLTRFDRLKEDSGYAASIEIAEPTILSSHAVKRFFRSISQVRVWLFRKVLQRLFLWRLQIEKPVRIVLGLDTMVMNNDDAHKREGVEPTYKKVKGFQPLQLFWGRYLIDAIFRNGKAHSNHGEHVRRMVTHIVGLIRSEYRKDIPIVVVADSGFFDGEIFALCDRLDIGFIIGGKMTESIKEAVERQPEGAFSEYKKGRQTWVYCEFRSRCQSWDTSYRSLYAKPISDEEGQIYLEFERPETVMYTNLGTNHQITERILEVLGAGAKRISGQAIIRAYHHRGNDELVNRGLKDFGTEQLSFQRFASNASFYYLMTIAFFLFEAYKYDMGSEVIRLTWYASTFRRRCLDIAGKIIRSGRQLIMKVTKAVYRSLQFDVLWERSMRVSPISLVGFVP